MDPNEPATRLEGELDSEISSVRRESQYDFLVRKAPTNSESQSASSNDAEGS